ncbi:MAG: hypothetical protein IPG50_02380 [Myxococcales bacterium]|nr:hypothetical protein [Myxococcales bacterium]
MTRLARSHTVPLSDGVRVKVQLGVAKARDGGRYLTQLAASVEEPAGWALSAAVAGTPTNRGAGTGASVIMAQALAITQRRATLRGTKLRTTVIEALADGTVTTR